MHQGTPYKYNERLAFVVTSFDVSVVVIIVIVINQFTGVNICRFNVVVFILIEPVFIFSTGFIEQVTVIVVIVVVVVA